jgi:hypothetical protein
MVGMTSASNNQIKLLWTNPNPYADMANNSTIALDLTEYFAIIIVFGEYMGDTWRRDNLTSHFCIKGQRHICPSWYMNGTSNSSYNTARAVTVSDTGVTLSHAVSSSNTYVNHTIPRYIYGVKM